MGRADLNLLGTKPVLGRNLASVAVPRASVAIAMTTARGQTAILGTATHK
jgi:hypothetical protein